MSAARPEQTEQWSTFLLAGEMFAVRVEDVQEVLMDQPLTRVPLAPPYIVGLLNLRGQIISAVDLRRRLQFSARTDDAPRKLLVLKTPDGPISIVVDDIGDVLRLESGLWRAPPDTLAAPHRSFVEAVCPIEGHLVIGLRVEHLGTEEPPAIASVGPRA
jgi:purine-binding chemotaxis protein CheW